jgi:hypothetical protein
MTNRKNKAVLAEIQGLVPRALNREMARLSSPDTSPEIKREAAQWVCGVIGYQPPNDRLVLDNATLLDLERRVADWLRQHQRRLLKGV